MRAHAARFYLPRVNNGVLLSLLLTSCFVFSVFDFQQVNASLVETSEAVRSSHRRCSVKKVFLETLQNSQESTCAEVSF